MDDLTIRQAAELQQQTLPETLYDSFLRWIDRSEKTTRTYMVNLRQFAVWLRYKGITAPEREDVIAYRDWLSSEHDAIQLDGDSWSYRTDSSGNRIRMTCRPSTVSLYLRSVKQFFSWTAASGYYPNIADGIHGPKVSSDTHRKEALPDGAVQKIEDSIRSTAAARSAEAAASHKDVAGRLQRNTEQSKRLNAMFQLAVNAGLRTVELSRADIRDFEQCGGRAWLYVWGKGRADADQKVALAPEVADAITDYLASRTDDWSGNSPLFVATGNRSHGKRLATTTISTMLKTAMVDAGYDSDRLTAHSLRHTAGSTVMELTGDNVYQTQHYMRHMSPKTTETYIHDTARAEQHDADTAEALYQHYHGHQSAGMSLDAVISRLTPEQMDALKTIATAMAQ